jgi:hypothetical protein
VGGHRQIALRAVVRPRSRAGGDASTDRRIPDRGPSVQLSSHLTGAGDVTATSLPPPFITSDFESVGAMASAAVDRDHRSLSQHPRDKCKCQSLHDGCFLDNLQQWPIALGLILGLTG